MQQKSFYILHFNDIYDIEEQIHEPKGGAARFLFVLNSLKSKLSNHLTFFSGDVFSPSSLTHIYNGTHMLYPLQEFKIDAAVLGNHDFDFPLDEIKKLAASSQTPWILSNVNDRLTDQPLADVLNYKVIEHGQFKIGVFGLAEEEWLSLITDIPIAQIEYRDYIEAAKDYCQFLRKDLGCNFIVALTHMRIPNDRSLINSLEPGLIDMVLGGHDHIWHHETVLDTFYAKSGTNFRNLGLIHVIPKETQLNEEIQNLKEWNFEFPIPDPIHFSTLKYDIQYYPIDVFGKIQVDPIMNEYVQEKIKKYNEQTQKVMAFTASDLEARFTIIRSQETSTSNLFADIIKLEFQTDLAFLNCGTIRADEYFSAGPLTYQNLDKLFAIPDYLVSFKLTGEELHQILENSVSKLPSNDGRFLGVSGIKFTYSLERPPMNRILSVEVNNQPLDLNKIYTGATKSFIADGGDGFTHIKSYIIDKTLGIQIKSVFVSFFEILKKTKLRPNNLNELKNTKYNKFLPLIYNIKENQGEYFIEVFPKVEGRIILVDQI